MLAPAFLLGLLAIGLPLWLHRMARANPQRAPFPSLMFLEASETQRSARHTLRYWLLLLLRILLLAALAFAFAQPLLAPQMAAPGAAKGRMHVIVVDASYSMRYGDRWPRALAAAERALVEVRGADQVMLVRASGQRMEVAHPATSASEAGAVRAALGALRPGLERLDYGRAMSAAQQWFEPDSPGVLHFISDLQQSGAPLRFADLEPPPHTQLAVHAVSEEASANAYIEAVVVSESDPRTLHATIRHTGNQPAARVVRLLVNGEERARSTVELPAAPTRVGSPLGEGGAVLNDARTDPAAETGARYASLASSASVAFNNVELAPGSHRLEWRLEPQDALPEDDAYFAVIERTQPRALLIANGERADDAAYLEAALGALSAPQLLVEQRTASALIEASVMQSSVAVVTDLGALSAPAAQGLTDFIAAGGGVLATLGERASNAQATFLHDWRIGEPRARLARVGQISTAHPVLRDPGEWSRVRSFKQRAVTPGADDRVLIEYEDGAPLLIERTIGAGRALILTAPIDRAWNDLAIHPVFVRFVAAAGRYLTGGDAAPMSRRAGEVVMTGLTATNGGQIFGPGGERVLSLAQARNAERMIPTLAGFYEVRSGAAARWIAVNVDPRESDLTPLPAEFVERWRALPMREPVRTQPSAVEAAEPARSLGPLLLWIAAVLILLEFLVANRHLAIRRGEAQ